MKFRLFSILPPQTPSQMKRNYSHFYADVVWFGVLNGSALSFLSVYATRIGASAHQIGLINAAPAIMALLFSLPFGAWIEPQSKRRATLITAFLMRVFYFPLFLIPSRLPAEFQVPIILVMVFLMYIPATGLGVAFNALFAEAIPIQDRAQIAGIRNVFFAIVSIITSLTCGYILNHFPFPMNYEVVFALGFISAMLSTLHLSLIRSSDDERFSLEKKFQAKGNAVEKDNQTNIHQKNDVIPSNSQLHLEILKTPFQSVLWMMFSFHFAQYLPLSLFPIFAVKVLKVSDQVISIANAIFFLAMLIISSQVSRLALRFGNQKITGLGLLFLSGYPFVLSLSHSAFPYLAAHLLGGTGWGLASSTMFNFVLEKAPSETRSAHLAWFNVFANAGILLGSLIGPWVSSLLGIRWALLVFAIFRFWSGLNIVRWK
ncbi:MAG: MFS transporter [Chloroflexota bacterium]